jgi:hypothetical protein
LTGREGCGGRKKEEQMGKALEWLGPEQCGRIAETLLEDVKERGGELWAICPFHQESTPGGAFSYNADKDVAHCRSCGTSTDLIGLYCAAKGMEPDDGNGFLEFRKQYAPNAPTSRPAAGPAMPTPRERSWAPVEPGPVPALWSEKAESFVNHARERLENTPAAIAELEARGISMATARACRLGWNDQDKYPPVSAWGMPRELKADGKEKKVWLPTGLVLPWMENGRVVKIKIRRELTAASYLPEQKYWEVVGGLRNRPHIYGRPEWTKWVLVETERDGVLVWQEVRHMQVGCMALGGATKRPDAMAAEILRRSDLILDALDADAAGAKQAWSFWAREFPQSVRWPAPPSLGKDVGDAVGKMSVAEWVAAGIPHHLQGHPGRGRTAHLRPQPSRPFVDEYASELPQGVQDLHTYLSKWTCLSVSLAGEMPEVDHPEDWQNRPAEWDILRRIDDLLADQSVLEFLAYHTCQILYAGNFWDGADVYLEEQRIIRGEA